MQNEVHGHHWLNQIAQHSPFEGSLLLEDTLHTSHDGVVIAIDGPAGAGKSTVARLLAEALGFEFLDTGSMYRCVTLAVLNAGVSPEDECAVAAIANQLKIELDGSTVLMDGEDVSLAIRTPKVATSIGLVADNVRVRKLLSQWQRDWARNRKVVTEGRDQGSDVFPDSPCKIFLVASSEERARRRQEELQQKGIDVDLQSVLEQQNKRDAEDAARPVGALRQAEDAILFCTDQKPLNQVLRELQEIIFSRIDARFLPNGSPR